MGDSSPDRKGKHGPRKRKFTHAPGARGRNNSLRRVKNSTEVLRQKSARKEEPSETLAPLREGRQYTVGNVGTGGWLYLRCADPLEEVLFGILTDSVARPAEDRPVHNAPTSHVQLPLTPPRSATLQPKYTETGTWSSTEQLAEPQHTFRSSNNLKRSATSARRSTERVSQSRHNRSHSFSSSRDLTPFQEAAHTALRIVIDRSDPEQEEPPPDTIPMPTLHVPIPHYKLGTPHFSTHGTPMLRHSAYTRSSAAPSDTDLISNITQPDLVFPIPPGPSDKWPMLLRNAGAGQRLRSSEEAQGFGSPPLPPGSIFRNSQPISPTLFDDLARRQDDPSVVRYARQTRSIVAATPARIVAQISSESFMDYDLVSDFFLTFRSYMSTMELLELLLARLRWAIGRMKEDGRIIRIRTFAAIRHWILNYFVDDFVLDRDLRLRFCELLNEIYDEVRNRAQSNQSDRKILQDLKRCWNGRCSIFWDSPYFAVDANLDADIIPGGVIQVRQSDSDLPYISSPDPMKTAKPTNPPPQPPAEPEKQPPIYRHSRGNIEISAVLPGSPGSELGGLFSSCSIPMSMPRWGPAGKHQQSTSDQPSVQTRRQKAPANLVIGTQSKGAHRRNAKSVDSNREPTPVQEDSMENEHLAGSFIRGHVYPPSSALVQVLSSFSADYPDRDLQGSPQANLKLVSSISPGTRSIFGSLRRALGAKQGGHDITMLAIPSTHRHGTIRGKIWTKPLSVTRSHDELRKKVDSRPVKTHLRVDLLCAAVAETYEAVRLAARAKDLHSEDLQGASVGLKHQSFLKPPTPPLQGSRRIPSQQSAQSGSILIVDDTRPDLPAMSGALPAGLVANDNMIPIGFAQPAPHMTDRSNGPKGNAFDPQHFLTSAAVGRDENSVKPYSTTPSSLTVRQADLAPNAIPLAEPQSGAAPVTSSFEEDKHSDDSKPPDHPLRRRPGGNLKKTQHVHDLGPGAHPRSLDSAGTDEDSEAESLVIMSNRGSQSGDTAPSNAQNRVSMIDTHSSQHLRPSFEAAVAGFSNIPDDDDGGLEATLLKLEGKYDKNSPLLHQTDTGSDNPQTPARQSSVADSPSTDKRQHRHLHVQESVHVQFDDHEVTKQLHSMAGKRAEYRGEGLGFSRGSTAASEDSKTTIPLIERNLSSEGAADGEQLVAADHPSLSHSSGDSQISHPSIEIVEKTASMEDIGRTSSGDHINPSSSARSFFLDEGENLSDLSSEISVDIINQADVPQRSFSPMVAAPGTARSGLELPSHPLGHTSDISDGSRLTDSAIKIDVNIADRRLTPDPGPVPERLHYDSGSDTRLSGQHSKYRVSIPLNTGPAHIPFILACDSQMLAQQFTLVEREALNEVQWIDLVEMRWDNKSVNTCDWAEYLSTTKHSGIDLVVTRFNLMVKWVVSEIVLTQDINERARTISKYIHTAAHARRLHNYSTMLQITIALTSADCKRLSQTWDLVCPVDRSLLKNMENLVQPVRNFHDLRAEMESSDLSDGCIPFIGKANRAL